MSYIRHSERARGCWREVASEQSLSSKGVLKEYRGVAKKQKGAARESMGEQRGSRGEHEGA